MESLKYLSTAFNKENNVKKLVNVIDESFDEIKELLEKVRDSHTVQASGKSLDYIASLFSLRRIDEDDKKFRLKIKLNASKIINSATINDLKTIIATALQTNTNRIKLREDDAYLQISIFGNDLRRAGVTAREFQDFARIIKPVGVKVIVVDIGTFTHRGINDENDPTKGYNDLNNSNPNAGTYAGLL